MQTVVEFARQNAGFSVALQPQAPSIALPHWIELLVDGLTFDLVGLSPGPAAAQPALGHEHGLPEGVYASALEAVTLQAGPHLASGAKMLPAVRSLAWLAAQLASLPELKAVAWHAARSWSAPEFFRDAVSAWLEGSAFPVRGLVELVAMPDGGLHSEGLALFCGQDLRLEPELVGTDAEHDQVASTVITWMFEHAPLERPGEVATAEGPRLRLEPSANGRFVRVWEK